MKEEKLINDVPEEVSSEDIFQQNFDTNNIDKTADEDLNVETLNSPTQINDATNDEKLANNIDPEKVSLEDTKFVPNSNECKSDKRENDNLQAESPNFVTQNEAKGAKKRNCKVRSPRLVDKRYRHATGPVTCPYCFENFQTTSEYHRHKKSKLDQTHRPLKHPCSFCGKLFHSSDMKRHLRTHQQHLLQCDKCPAKFSARLTYERHKKRHTGEQYALCEICGKAVLDKYALKTHTLTHNTERKHLCSICGKGFRYETTYIYHMKRHNEGNLHICNICTKEFKTENVLQTHLLTHCEKQWSCEACGKCFKLKTTLTNHLKTHDKKETYRCSHCSMVFTGRCYYEAHIKFLNDKDIKPIDFPETEHQCQICSKYFATKGNLNNHMGIHNEIKILCSVCGKKFNSKAALNCHSIVHTGEKRFACKICNKRFSSSGWLKTHNFIHTGERPFVCNVCSKGFTQGPKLKIHMRTHTGERPYICPHCNKSYRNRSYLVVHIRSHTGETPYMCEVCSKGFHHSGNLKKHQRTHFKESLVKDTSEEEN